MSLRKVVEGDKFTFLSYKDKIAFELGERITFGEDIYDSYLLEDLRLTLDGIQLSFRTNSGEAAVFSLISTIFDISNKSFIIKADKTKKPQAELISNLINKKLNIYIASIKLEESENALNIVLSLSKDTTFYTAEIRNGSFAEVCFSNVRKYNEC